MKKIIWLLSVMFLALIVYGIVENVAPGPHDIRVYFSVMVGIMMFLGIGRVIIDLWKKRNK